MSWCGVNHELHVTKKISAVKSLINVLTTFSNVRELYKECR